MSFRTRLTVFFVLIVAVPMLALGVVVARLVTDSEEGKANARAGAHVASAMRTFSRASIVGRARPVCSGSMARLPVRSATATESALSHVCACSRERTGSSAS